MNDGGLILTLWLISVTMGTLSLLLGPGNSDVADDDKKRWDNVESNVHDRWAHDANDSWHTNHDHSSQF